MKTPLLFAFTAPALVWLAGCATTADVPRVSYPVSYSIQVGNAQVATSAGGQNLTVAPTQQVEVVPHEPLYYRVDAPVDVTVSVFELTRNGERSLLGQMRGTRFTTSVMPRTSQIEFAFNASQPNSSGMVQFTLSDEPIPAARVIAE